MANQATGARSAAAGEDVKTKTLRQTVTFEGATPAAVYDLIADSRKHTSLSQVKAVISRKVGGRFSASAFLPP